MPRMVLFEGAQPMERHSRAFGLMRCCVMLLLLAATECIAQLTPVEIATLLADHNQVRSTVTPTAANMTRLVWDPALAVVAQNWANRCNWAHNPGANAAYAALSPNAGGVGENIFVTTGSRVSALTGANSGVANWTAERTSYNYAANTCAPGQACGHYTQLVWARTLRVGCAITQCAAVTGLPAQFNNSQLLVCNYNPAGNFVGQLPYVQGAPGTQCPPGLPKLENGLCSPAPAIGPALSSSLMMILELLLTDNEKK